MFKSPGKAGDLFLWGYKCFLFKDGTMDDLKPWSHDWDRPGHIAVVRPKDPDCKGEPSESGVYIAQAGDSNYECINVETGFEPYKMAQTEAPRDYFNEDTK